MISWAVALVALLLMLLLYKYIEYRGAQVQWGDGLEALHLQIAQKNLWTLERQHVNSELEHEHAKNWRPHVMLFVELQETLEGHKRVKHPTALDFLSQLKKGGGLNIVSTLCIGDISKQMFDGKFKEAQELLKNAVKAHHLDAFTQVSISTSLSQGVLSAIQCTGVGSLKPNTVMLGWPAKPSPGFVQLLRSIIALDKALILLKGLPSFPSAPLCHHHHHHNHHNNHQHHHHHHHHHCNTHEKHTVDVYWVVHDGGILTLLAHILLKHPVWKSCRLRIFAVAPKFSDNSIEMKKNLKATLEHLRIEADADVLELGEGEDVRPFAYLRTLRLKEREELLKKVAGVPGNNQAAGIGVGGNGGAINYVSSGTGQGGDTLALPTVGSAVHLTALAAEANDGAGLAANFSDNSGADARNENDDQHVVVVEVPNFDNNTGGVQRSASVAVSTGSEGSSGNGEGGSGVKFIAERMRTFTRRLSSRKTSFSLGVGGGNSLSATNVFDQPYQFQQLSLQESKIHPRPEETIPSIGEIWQLRGLSKSEKFDQIDEAETESNADKVSVMEDNNRPATNSSTFDVSETQPESCLTSPASVQQNTQVPSQAIQLPLNESQLSKNPNADSDPLLEDYRLQRMNTAMKLNDLMKATSSKSTCQLIICNLPAPGVGGGVNSGNYNSEQNATEPTHIGDQTPSNAPSNSPPPSPTSKTYTETEYIEYLEAMTEGIERIMLVKGTGFEVVTDFY
jgi:hypothetical protein